MILQDADSKPNSDWFGKFWWPLSMSSKFQTKFSMVWKNHWPNTQSALLCGLIVTHFLRDILALLGGFRGALVSRGLKALFLHLSRALLGILSGALLCHLIMADFTLNIAAMLWGLHWTFKARHIVALCCSLHWTQVRTLEEVPKSSKYLYFVSWYTSRKFHASQLVISWLWS